VGRPQLQYLKQVARNTGAELYSNEGNGLQQFQMESCQPIKRLKDKKKKRKRKKKKKKIKLYLIHINMYIK